MSGVLGFFKPLKATSRSLNVPLKRPFCYCSCLCVNVYDVDGRLVKLYRKNEMSLDTETKAMIADIRKNISFYKYAQCS